MLTSYMKHLAFVFCLILLVACNSDETSRDAFVELKRVTPPGGNKSILFYQYASDAENKNTSMILIVDKDEQIDLRNQAYFSNIDLDTIYWKTKDTVIAVEKYLNYLVKGKSNYKDSIYPMNGVIVKIVRVDPVDSNFVREELYRQKSPDKQQELQVFRYVHPLNKYAILNVSIVDANNKGSKYGNFYVGKSDFDCIRDIRWDSIGDFTIKASKKCYYGFDEYLNKQRPSVKYNLVLSEEIGNTSLRQPVDTTVVDSLNAQL